MIELTIPEQSTLLYLESCAVDYAGKCEPIRMNKDDFFNIEKFRNDGLLDFGRIYSKSIMESPCKDKTHWVEFTDKGFEVAAHYRKVRALRMLENRTYLKANEERKSANAS